jgi:hypothetical protein
MDRPTASGKEQPPPVSSTPSPVHKESPVRQVDGGASFSRISEHLSVYAIYAVLSGWAFGTFYLRELGISPRWVDLSVSDVLIYGFTVLLSGVGKWLLPFYLSVLLIPLLVELPPWSNRISIRILNLILLMVLLWPIYLISRSAGVEEARIDTNPQSSRLPRITFASKDKKYVGRLAYLKDGVYFIREATDIGPLGREDRTSRLTLSIYRAEDISDVRVVRAW